jgi:hypothetical protein
MPKELLLLRGDHAGLYLRGLYLQTPWDMCLTFQFKIEAKTEA